MSDGRRGVRGRCYRIPSIPRYLTRAPGHYSLILHDLCRHAILAVLPEATTV